MTNQEFMGRFGDWAVVTGASSGIGRVIAGELAARGLKIVAVGRSGARLNAARAAWKTESIAVEVDLASPDGARRVVEACVGLRVGLLVNSAGFGVGGPLVEHTVEDELGMLDVNCRALLELTHRFGERFVAERRGAVVLLSSIVAFQGVARLANYAATKAYVQSLGEALREEWKQAGVEVLIAAPGPTASGFAARAGMTMERTDSSERVGREIVDALGRGFVVPGRVGKLLHAALSTAPRFLRVRIMKGVMEPMTRAQH
jgi:hypothetical protein